MKIDRDEFNTKLGYLARAIPKKEVIPITGCVLIESDGSNVKMTTTDQFVTVTTSISAEGNEEKFCPQFKTLKNVVSGFDKGEVEMTYENATVVLKKGGSKYKIPTVPYQEFPKPPKVDGNEVEIPTGNFITKLNRCERTVQHTSMGISVEFVHVFSKEGKIWAESTDQVAISRAWIGDSDDDMDVLLPPNTSRLIPEEESVIMRWNDSHISFEGESFTSTVTTAAMKRFANCDRVIDIERNSQVKIPRNDVHGALNRLLNTSDQTQNNRCVFEFDEGTIKMRAENNLSGTSGEESLSLLFQDNNVDKIAFDAQKLLTIVDSCSGDLMLFMSDFKTAVMLKEELNENDLWILAPVHFQ